jgi:hypothetical protein
LILARAVCWLLAGCVPQDSLFPLFLRSDQVFEEGILGEWMAQGGTQEISSDEKSGQLTSERGAQDRTYDVTMPDIEEDGATLASIGRLVRLGIACSSTGPAPIWSAGKTRLSRIQR